VDQFLAGLADQGEPMAGSPGSEMDSDTFAGRTSPGAASPSSTAPDGENEVPVVVAQTRDGAGFAPGGQDVDAYDELVATPYVPGDDAESESDEVQIEILDGGSDTESQPGSDDRSPQGNAAGETAGMAQSTVGDEVLAATMKLKEDNVTVADVTVHGWTLRYKLRTAGDQGDWYAKSPPGPGGRRSTYRSFAQLAKGLNVALPASLRVKAKSPRPGGGRAGAMRLPKLPKPPKPPKPPRAAAASSEVVSRRGWRHSGAADVSSGEVAEVSALLVEAAAAQTMITPSSVCSTTALPCETYSPLTPANRRHVESAAPQNV